MPAGDRTGPMGQGPMTGRGAGGCADDDMPDYTTPPPGRGRGRGGRGWGGGCGRGWGHGAFEGMRRGWGRPFGVPPAPTREQEIDALRRYAESTKAELEAINRHIDELERKTDED